MTWMQVEAYLEVDDRCVLPLGSTEQHAYISLATDSILSERVAVEAAEPLGVPVFPPLCYGITPYFMAYPGTVTLSLATYERVIVEILGSLRRHGFRRILVLNGHGGNSPARPAAEAWAVRKEGVELARLVGGAASASGSRCPRPRRLTRVVDGDLPLDAGGGGRAAGRPQGPCRSVQSRRPVAEPLPRGHGRRVVRWRLRAERCRDGGPVGRGRGRGP